MWKLIIGIVFIIGGLSGKMVLRGTDSGLALAGFGVILCIWGGIQMKDASKAARPVQRRPILKRRPVAPGRRPAAPSSEQSGGADADAGEGQG